MKNKCISVVLIGAGNRGEVYTNIMKDLGDCFKVVAVAEPIDSRRMSIQKKHNIPDKYCFADWSDLFALGRIADLAVIATMDKQHYLPTMKAISLKYDILLEKPVSPNPEECMKISQYAEEMCVHVIVCHVLRYSPMFVSIKKLLDSGRLGEIVSINHEECVGNVHQSHSFVRGNWGNSQRSSFMLLQKSCHDMDILQWLIGKKCKKVQSFGFLSHFTAKNAPVNSPDYCIDGCPEGGRCPYNAVKLYFDDKQNEWFRSTCTKEVNPTDEQVEQALRTTQYGKCVYKCDNDVVDHQTINMLFDDEVTVTFTMNAFNKGGRFIHVMGTKGELRAALDGQSPIILFDFEERHTSQIALNVGDGIPNGHGGGDEGLIHSLYDFLQGTYTGNSISDIATSVDSHMIAFAAELARTTETIVDLDEYISSFVNN